MTDSEAGFEPLFNGTDLTGWVAKPRIYGHMYPGGPHVLEWATQFPRDYNEVSALHPALWSVEDDVIVGRQDETDGGGWGGFLVTERTFTDFELRLEMKPDWPADSGVILRKQPDSWEGFQVLLDHRRSGAIGGFYGNGIGSFHAIPFTITAERDADGNPIGLTIEDDPADSVEPFDPSKAALLDYAVSAEEFLATWRWNDWNDLVVRCEGEIPAATTWINGVKIASIDLATLEFPNFVAADAAEALGNHIALEVHDTDPMIGAERWGLGAACRWRNIRIKEL